MNGYKLIIIFACIFALFILYIYYRWINSTSKEPSDKLLINNHNQNNIKYDPSKNAKVDYIVDYDGNYRGLVLFDVDGTLTTGKDNYQSVQTCLEHGFAVGICTAESIYTIENLENYFWMPKNLYEFMKNTNFITFNNVASGYLTGKLNRKAYESINTPLGYDIYGYRKGFALEQTGKLLGIKNTKNLILCDDLKVFIMSILKYNPNFSILCAGEDCKGELTEKRLNDLFFNLGHFQNNTACCKY
jgi:hypothetical protein